jgi:hypothetical protein
MYSGKIAVPPGGGGIRNNNDGVKRKALDNLTHKPAKLLRQELRQNGFLDQIFTYDVYRARKN